MVFVHEVNHEVFGWDDDVAVAVHHTASCAYVVTPELGSVRYQITVLIVLLGGAVLMDIVELTQTVMRKRNDGIKLLVNDFGIPVFGNEETLTIRRMADDVILQRQCDFAGFRQQTIVGSVRDDMISPVQFVNLRIDRFNGPFATGVNESPFMLPVDHDAETAVELERIVGMVIIKIERESDRNRNLSLLVDERDLSVFDHSCQSFAEVPGAVILCRNDDSAGMEIDVAAFFALVVPEDHDTVIGAVVEEHMVQLRGSKLTGAGVFEAAEMVTGPVAMHHCDMLRHAFLQTIVGVIVPEPIVCVLTSGDDAENSDNQGDYRQRDDKDFLPSFHNDKI